jgi:quercetin dioxygenase-like cupin family protein
MKKQSFVAALVFVSAVLGITGVAVARKNVQRPIVGLTPAEVRWFTPPYYNDGRERARMLGDSSQDGVWVDRAKIPAGAHVRAHTHPHDEVVTVIQGTWYLGEGEKFDASHLKAYPQGSFIVIPAGVPHFVATKEGPVIVQLEGNGKFTTDYVEK